MKHSLLVGAFALVMPLAASAAPLSESECNSVWKEANPSGAPTITEAQAQPYVTDFKAADPDNDGTLSKSEFSAACKSGYVTAMVNPSGEGKMAPGTSRQ
jgi:hypothetical protein